jgi:hypothetical protein
MPVLTKKTRKAVIAVGVLAGIALAGFPALAWYGHILDSRNPYGGHNSYGMRDYTPHDEEKAAKAIIAGLNTRNPDNVELLRFHGHPKDDVANQAIAENITAVLPPPGCQYVLVGIEDKVAQDHPAALVPWYRSVVEHAWGFDMNLRQLCSGHQPTPRTVRVIAIDAGWAGYWAEAALEERETAL